MLSGAPGSPCPAVAPSVEGPAAPLTAPGSITGGGCPTSGTATRAPSPSFAARLSRSRSAPATAPPAARIASSTRAFAGNLTTPLTCTAPTTSTTISAAVVVLIVDAVVVVATVDAGPRAGLQAG